MGCGRGCAVSPWRPSPSRCLGRIWAVFLKIYMNVLKIINIESSAGRHGGGVHGFFERRAAQGPTRKPKIKFPENPTILSDFRILRVLRVLSTRRIFVIISARVFGIICFSWKKNCMPSSPSDTGHQKAAHPLLVMPGSRRLGQPTGQPCTYKAGCGRPANRASNRPRSQLSSICSSTPWPAAGSSSSQPDQASRWPAQRPVIAWPPPHRLDVVLGPWRRHKERQPAPHTHHRPSIHPFRFNATIH